MKVLLDECVDWRLSRAIEGHDVRTARQMGWTTIRNGELLALASERETNPRAYEPNLGERAAVEVIEEPARLQDDEKAVLLCEETAVTRRIVVRERARIIELTTMDFLRLLEEEKRIQSADAVFDRALAAGRTPSRVEKFSDHDPSVRDAVRETLRKAQEKRLGHK